MSRLLSPAAERWARQPQIPVGIDSSNTITQLLRFAYNGATGIDHVYLRDRNPFPAVMPAGAPLRAAPKDAGRGRRQSGVDTDQLQIYFVDRAYPPPTSYSITLAVQFYAASAKTQTAFAFANETFDIGFEIGTSGTNVDVWAKDYTGTNWEQTTGPTYSAGDVIDAVVVVTAGAPLKLYVGKGGAVSSSTSNFDNDSVGFTGVTPVVGDRIIAGSTNALNGIVTHAMVWDRALSQSEVKEVLRNPWRVFAPLRRLVFPNPTIPPPQLLSPVSDVSAGSWTPSSGTDLYAMLDETVASDTDYIAATSATTCTLALASGSDPASSTGHILRYRLPPGSGTVSVALKQGTTTIASWGPHSLTGSAQDFAQTLTGSEADSITDYSALRVEFTSALA